MEAWRERLETLAERVRAVKAENEQLKIRLHDQLEALKAMDLRLKKLDQGNKVFLAERDAKAPTVQDGTKEKINELVNEIDQCLALLSPP